MLDGVSRDAVVDGQVGHIVGPEGKVGQVGQVGKSVGRKCVGVVSEVGRATQVGHLLGRVGHNVGQVGGKVGKVGQAASKGAWTMAGVFLKLRSVLWFLLLPWLLRLLLS